MTRRLWVGTALLLGAWAGGNAAGQTTPSPASNPAPGLAPAQDPVLKTPVTPPGPQSPTAIPAPLTTTPAGQAATIPAPAPPAVAGQQPGQAGDQVYVLPTVRVSLVNLVFTVTDKHGRFVTGLRKGNFGLLDDGYAPAQVVGFQQLTALPLRVGIMLDTSSSIRTRFKFEQDAAVDFFLQVLHPADRAFVEGFDVQTFLPQDYTANISLLNDGIRKLRPGGGTSLYDSLYRTCRDQMLSLRSDGEVRKAIVLVSDGEDNYSHAGIQDSIKMCQRAETVVYTISTDVSPDHGTGGSTMRTIAEATGGQAFFPERLEDVALGFQRIEEELRSQYSLEYRPANFKQDGSFRTINLQAIDSRYQVHARTGYFAPRAGGAGAELSDPTLDTRPASSSRPKKKLSRAEKKELKRQELARAAAQPAGAAGTPE